MSNTTSWPSLVIVCLPAFVASGACDSGGAGTTAEALTIKQEYLPPEHFEVLVETDADLAATVGWAKATRSVDHVERAVTMEDADGVYLVAARYAGASGQAAVIVRHCEADDCVSAVVDEPAPGEVTWTTEAGPIALRTILPSSLLRELDPDDPIRTAVLVPS